MALPSGGSMFLALDRNRNGRFDDGSELFGARTGDGFAELAALDDDRDGWIDEDDAAYAELRVWDGETTPLSLREAGVGAINVGSVATPFTLGGSDATATGVLRSTGVWLAEERSGAHRPAGGHRHLAGSGFGNSPSRRSTARWSPSIVRSPARSASARSRSSQTTARGCRRRSR